MREDMLKFLICSTEKNRKSVMGEENNEEVLKRINENRTFLSSVFNWNTWIIRKIILGRACYKRIYEFS